MLCTKCGEKVRPVVALDIDGTLGDYHGHFLKFAQCWLGAPSGSLIRYDGSKRLAEHMGIEDETYRKIKLAYRQGGNKRLMPTFPHAALLAQEMRSLGAEIWITTTRPYNRYDAIDPDTRHWLERNEIQYDHILYDDDKYASLIEQVHPQRVIGVVDDLPKCYDRANELGLHPILRKTVYNRAVHRPIESDTLAAIAIVLISRIETWNAKHERLQREA